MKDNVTTRAKLPPWEPRNERERRDFIEWCCAELIMLDNQLHPDDHKQDDYKMSPEVAHQQRLRERLERAKVAAHNGDATLLRKLYPEISEFIYPYRRKRGERRSYRKPGTWVEEYVREGQLDAAIETVRQLREMIWPQHYGRSKRRFDNPPSAETIAADFHNLGEGEIRQALKARSRRRR